MIATTPLTDSELIIDLGTGEVLEEVLPDNEAPEGVDKDLWKQWMDNTERKKDPFLVQLERGMDGQNIGLSNGLFHVNQYIYGTHKARYYLLGGESGAGKTTIGDFMYVLNAWQSAKAQGRPIKIFYLSFEIGKTEKLYRWCSYYIFLKWNLQLPSDYLQGRINGKLVTDQHSMMILEAYGTVKEMLKDINIVQDTLHPTKVFEDLIESHFAKHGTVDRAKLSAEDAKKGKKGYVKGYTENDPAFITILIADTLNLVGTEMGLDTKGAMDKLSKYAIVLRNLFHCTVVFYQQFSTDMMATYRGMMGKKNEASITPQRLDFGDSKTTYRDADVVIGFIKPQNDLQKFHKYDLGVEEGLGNWFTAAFLMKNRYGPASRMSPLFVDGISGFVYDLPLEPTNPLRMEEWYDKAKQLESICRLYSPQSR